MPRISQLMIRTALLYLALGTTIGGLLLAEKGLRLWPWLWVLRPGHVQMLLVGWVVQLACGVAVWILPRLDAAGSRGDLRLVRVAYGALNGGVALAALHQPLGRVADAGFLGWMPGIAGLLQLVGMIMLIGQLWPRVLPFRLLPRPEVQ